MLAAQGRNVLLVARSEEKLITLCNELGETVLRAVYCHGPDGTRCAGPLFEETVQRGLTIDLLINNAGFGACRFRQGLAERQLNMIDLKFVAGRSTYRFLPTRSAKRLIIKSPLTAGQPVPFMTTYAATKVFVLSRKAGKKPALRRTLYPLSRRHDTISAAWSQAAAASRKFRRSRRDGLRGLGQRGLHHFRWRNLPMIHRAPDAALVVTLCRRGMMRASSISICPQPVLRYVA